MMEKVDYYQEPPIVSVTNRVQLDVRPLSGWTGAVWLSDDAHNTSTYPTSRDFVERALKGVPDDERKLLCYENALNLSKV